MPTKKAESLVELARSIPRKPRKTWLSKLSPSRQKAVEELRLAYNADKLPPHVTKTMLYDLVKEKFGCTVKRCHFSRWLRGEFDE